MLAAYTDAATYVDAKWERAFAKAEEVRNGYRRLLDDPEAHVTLGQNTHELVVRFISALPLKTRRQIITTDEEFHSVSRQLQRLAEEGIEILSIPAHPVQTLAERIAHRVSRQTAAVILSSVLFKTGYIVPHLRCVAESCKRQGAELLVDVYHALNVVPFSVKEHGLEDAFIVGGGYKYCQLGEGVCFLRIPHDCQLRPVVTGWFSVFDRIESHHVTAGPIQYGENEKRFAGSTYDPISHYRAAEVLQFFQDWGLSVPVLRQKSQSQLQMILENLSDRDPSDPRLSWDYRVPLTERGGFLAFQSSMAKGLAGALTKANILVDVRGTSLRLGPAPYVSEEQLVYATEALRGALHDAH
jgi:kynureninase